MEQITCMQPKGPVAVSFLKNLYDFFLNLIIFQKVLKKLIHKKQVLPSTEKVVMVRLLEIQGF